MLGTDHDDTLDSMKKIPIILQNLGRYTETLQLVLDLLEIQRQKLGEDHVDTLNSKYCKALALNSLGHHTEALELAEELISRELNCMVDHMLTL